MSRRRRKATETFGLSFLDVICCGFGAVILFYTIISAQSGLERIRQTTDLSSEVSRIEEQVLEGTRNLVIMRNALEEAQSETVSAAQRATRVLQELEQRRDQMSVYDDTSLARRERIERLKADIRALEEGTRRLEAGSLARAAPGQEVRQFRGTGDRRYITGIQMRGKRTLILVDRSASMLHPDLVTILVLRNSAEDRRRAAAKWRRAIDTADWLLTQLPPDSQYKIMTFNSKAEPLIPGTWHGAGDAESMARSIQGLRSLVPDGGTSFHNAFAAAKALSPQPDQIILITDGLPTLGATPGNRRFIDANSRARLFDQAIGELPDGVPVDIVLLPLNGDLPAAHRFWRLASLTNGSLIMPAKDWP
jgi:anti-sigma28 factor (negative regulator of flagellin synthesis)